MFFTQGLVYRIAIATGLLAYVIGFFFYLLVDKPIKNIDKMVLFPTKLSDSFLVKKKKNKKNENDSHMKKMLDSDNRESRLSETLRIKSTVRSEDLTEDNTIHPKVSSVVN